MQTLLKKKRRQNPLEKGFKDDVYNIKQEAVVDNVKNVTFFTLR